MTVSDNEGIENGESDPPKATTTIARNLALFRTGVSSDSLVSTDVSGDQSEHNTTEAEMVYQMYSSGQYEPEPCCRLNCNRIIPSHIAIGHRYPLIIFYIRFHSRLLAKNLFSWFTDKRFKK